MTECGNILAAGDHGAMRVCILPEGHLINGTAGNTERDSLWHTDGTAEWRYAATVGSTDRVTVTGWRTSAHPADPRYTPQPRVRDILGPMVAPREPVDYTAGQANGETQRARRAAVLARVTAVIDRLDVAVYETSGHSTVAQVMHALRFASDGGVGQADKLGQVSGADARQLVEALIPYINKAGETDLEEDDNL